MRGVKKPKILKVKGVLCPWGDPLRKMLTGNAMNWLKRPNNIKICFSNFYTFPKKCKYGGLVGNVIGNVIRNSSASTVTIRSQTMAIAWGLSALRVPLCKMCKFERSQNNKICKTLAKMCKFGRSQQILNVKRERGQEAKNIKS